MRKIVKGLAALVLAALVLFLGVGSAIIVTAETLSDEPTISQSEETEKSDLAVAAEKFVEYLKEKYGEDYEYYYNKIIEEWGSIEGYLLAFSDKLPEGHKSGWDAFVSWLGEYSVVWAPTLAVGIIIILAVLGKKQFNKIVEKIVNGKLKPVVKELNLQSNALAKMLDAQRALLGNCEKFSEEAKGLEEAVKELKNE